MWDFFSPNTQELFRATVSEGATVIEVSKILRAFYEKVGQIEDNNIWTPCKIKIIPCLE